MTSLLVDELWKRMQEKEAELDKVIQDYIKKGIIKVTGDRGSQHSQVISIVDHIERIREDMIRYMNQWREFKRIEEDGKD